MGGYKHLGWVLGEYARGYRILTAFSPSGRPEDLALTLDLREQSLLANDLGLFAHKLGRLAEARTIQQVGDEWVTSLGVVC